MKGENHSLFWARGEVALPCSQARGRCQGCSLSVNAHSTGAFWKATSHWPTWPRVPLRVRTRLAGDAWHPASVSLVAMSLRCCLAPLPPLGLRGCCAPRGVSFQGEGPQCNRDSLHGGQGGPPTGFRLDFAPYKPHGPGQAPVAHLGVTGRPHSHPSSVGMGVDCRAEGGAESATPRHLWERQLLPPQSRELAAWKRRRPGRARAGPPARFHFLLNRSGAGRLPGRLSWIPAFPASARSAGEKVAMETASGLFLAFQRGGNGQGRSNNPRTCVWEGMWGGDVLKLTPLPSSICLWLLDTPPPRHFNSFVAKRQTRMFGTGPSSPTLGAEPLGLRQRLAGALASKALELTQCPSSPRITGGLQ